MYIWFPAVGDIKRHDQMFSHIYTCFMPSILIIHQRVGRPAVLRAECLWRWNSPKLHINDLLNVQMRGKKKKKPLNFHWTPASLCKSHACFICQHIRCVSRTHSLRGREMETLAVINKWKALPRGVGGQSEFASPLSRKHTLYTQRLYTHTYKRFLPDLAGSAWRQTSDQCYIVQLAPSCELCGWKPRESKPPIQNHSW